MGEHIEWEPLTTFCTEKYLSFNVVVVDGDVTTDKRILKFIRTCPSPESIEEFIETEARRRIKEIQDEQAHNKKLRFILFSKDMMATQGDKIKEWAKTKDNELLAKACKDVIDASKELTGEL